VRFLIHGNLNPSVKAAVERHGHVAFTYAEADIRPDLDAAELLTQAHQKQLDVVTNDKDLSHYARTTSVKFARSLVYLQMAGDDVEQDDAIDRLFARYKSPKPHMLYTITETRVKIQQLKSS
jgi:predicted nuclease of predicted toxin-antitoxin system